MRWRPAFIFSGALLPLFLGFVSYEVRASRSTLLPPDWSTASSVRYSFIEHNERSRDAAGQITQRFEARRVDVLANGDYDVTGLTRAQWFAGSQERLAVSAGRARISARGHDVAAVGKVVATSSPGIALRAEEVYYFAADGKFYTPQVGSVSWQAAPNESPAEIKTRRLFYWPATQRLDLPDPLTAAKGADNLQAAAASAQLERRGLRLLGPATLNTSLQDLGDPRPLSISVGQGTTLAWNAETGAASAVGPVTAALPTANTTLSATNATYSGRATATLVLDKDLVLTEPRGTLTAARGRVDLAARRATASGSARFSGTTDDGPLTISADQISYRYQPGSRSANAKGDVRIDTLRVSAAAPSLEADLEAERAKLSGSVRLRTTPGALGGTASSALGDAPLEITAPGLTTSFRRGARWTRTQGAATFRQGDREGRAQALRWDQERNVVVLDGDVTFKNNQGERARCGKLTYDLNTDQMLIEDPIFAEILVGGEDR